MKKVALLFALIAILAAISTLGLMKCKPSPINMPEPTEIKWDMEEGNKGESRREWFNLMHKAAPDIDWEDIEYKTAMKKHRMKSQRRASLQQRSGEEVFANGQVSGVWQERGSSNQAGSVRAVDYDAITDQLYTIGDGGSLWKRSRLVNDWTLINDDLRFDRKPLHIIYKDSQQHIVTAIRGIPHISLDGGATWNASGGDFGGAGGHVQGSEVYEVEGEIQIVMLQKSTNNERYRIIYSTDGGVNYQVATQFNSSDNRDFAMDKVNAFDQVFIIEQLDTDQSRLSQWNVETQSLDIVATNIPIAYGERGRANIQVVPVNGGLKFYTYDDANIIYSSIDMGQTWEEGSLIQDQNSEEVETPWEVGMIALENAPNVLITGAVQANRSTDGGDTWNYINRWWEYYPDPKRFLHADIMDMKEFETADGEIFVIINNHGGMYISYNNTGQLENISLEGLNVSQYYDVRSYPIDESVVFAGSQDQGFQRAYFEGDGPQPFEQVISGDYGHIEFTDNGRSLWTVYPFGLVHFYRDPEFDGVTAQYTVESEDESVWIIPLMADPDPTGNVVYVAGGSADGGPGEYIIKLEYRQGEIVASNLPFNFGSVADDISAMEVDPNNENIWYVATQSGDVFKSEDRGISFAKLQVTVPGGNYLYGADILISKKNSDVVYICGSGYSTSGIRVSRDGGSTWKSAINGLPKTLTFALAYNEDESLIYAATEAGPYVYVVAEEMWYDLTGVEVPNQTFWSVEYLPDSRTVRYGTYGRGIWDFDVSEIPVNVDEVESENKIELVVYPNPAVERISIKGVAGEDVQLSIYDQNGVLVKRSKKLNNIDISNLYPGVYICKIKNLDNYYNTSFVKQ